MDSKRQHASGERLKEEMGEGDGNVPCLGCPSTASVGFKSGNVKLEEKNVVSGPACRYTMIGA